MALSDMERINIKDLTIEDPVKNAEDFRFDPSKEFDQADIETCADWLEQNKYDGSDIYPNGAYRFAVMFPEQRKLLNLDEKARTACMVYVGQTTGGRQNMQALQNLKVLFPKILNQRAFDRTPDFKDTFHELRYDEWDSEYVLTAACLKIAYPKKFEELGLTHNDFIKFKEKYKDFFVSDTLWMSLRIMFPNVPRTEFISRKRFEEKKRKVQRAKKFTLLLERNLNDAYELAILTADKIEIDESGIKIISHLPEFKADTPPLPETRRF